MSLAEIAKLYCETQESEPSELITRLNRALGDNGKGILLLRFIDMGCSRLGQRVCLIYGPANTYKEIPPDGHIFHPYGLASDSAELEGVYIR